MIAEARTDGDLVGFDSVRLEHLNDIFGMIDTVAGCGMVYGDRIYDDLAVNKSISPRAVTVDKAENLYLVNRHQIYKVDQEGIITTVAGTQDPGFSGDGGPALSAQLDEPGGLAVDEAGNLYVADTRNHRIRKIDPSGVITTVAGTGSNEHNGVAGPAIELNLSYPKDVALDPDGNLFIADTQHYRVLKMDRDGFITFEAGQIEWVNPYVVYPALYMLPTGIGISADGTLYIADHGNNVIWRMDGAQRTRVAGVHCYLCEPGYNGGEGIATEIRLNGPLDVAVDATGALIISEERGYRIRRVDPDGNLTTIVGRGVAPCRLGYYGCSFESAGGDNGPSNLAQVYLPLSVAVGPSGAIYIADRNNYRIRRVREIGTTTSVAGTVSDAETGLPLSNAHVSLQQASLSYDTDTASDGSFVIPNAAALPGDLVIAVHAPDYISNRTRSTIIDPSEDQTIDVALFKRPELVVSIASPQANSRVLASPVEVAGDISHTATVHVNGVEAVISGRTYTAPVPLNMGANTITVTADDPYGQRATTQTQVTLIDTRPTVNLNISSMQIEYGQSLELSWNSTHAQTAVIEPVIGAVEANGSLILTPDRSTTYTITVSGPGGTASAQATVTVTVPLPSIAIDADPPSVVAGAFSTLTWRSAHADTVTIDPGVGRVDANGSMVVFPSATTTYTVTAQGLGGTVTQTTTINVRVPEPEIAFVVDRPTIAPGTSATLSWNTNHADTCTLAPDFGSVGPNGTAQVMPPRTTEYVLTAAGPGGTTTARVTIAVIADIAVTIISPADHAVIARPDVMVCGTFDNSSGNETGITVNGKPAMVYGNTFAINHVSLLNGENTIAVTATDIDGQTGTEQVSVTATQPAHHVTVNAAVESGSLPLASALAISGTFGIADSGLSFSGPGPVEIVESGADRYRIRLTDPGIYYVTAEVVHGAAVYTDTIAMLGVDPVEIDLLLRQKWSDMKTALRSGDIEQALRYHHPRSQERYRAIYTALGSDLPGLAAQMEDISRIYCVDGTAKYRIRQTHDVDGRLVPITYYVYFVRDDNGLWRIQKY